MDKELKKKLQILWTGNIIDVTSLDNWKEFERATLTFLPDNGNMQTDVIEISAFGYSAQDAKKCKPGDRAEIAFIPVSKLSRDGNRYFTTLELIRIKSIGFESAPEQTARTTPEETYPAGNKMPCAGPIGAVQESDFDFGQG